MDKQEVKEVFKDQFEQLANASVREGTVIVDQIIDPLVLVNMPIYEEVDNLLEQAALPYEADQTELLDVVGERFFTSRITGDRARTSVVLLLSEPTRIEINEDVRFFTQDRRAFEPRQSSIIRPGLITEREGGRFVTPQIEVVAVEEGKEYSVSAGEIQVTNLSNPAIERAENPSSSTNGSSGESDEEYYDRIRRAVSTQSLDTPRGMLYSITDQFSGEVDRITIVGAGDDEMTRDVQRVAFSTREVPLDISAKINR